MYFLYSDHKIMHHVIMYHLTVFNVICQRMEFQNHHKKPEIPPCKRLRREGSRDMKKYHKKSLTGDKDIETALLQYSTLKHIGYLPSQLLMSRICKMKISISADLFQPKLC